MLQATLCFTGWLSNRKEGTQPGLDDRHRDGNGQTREKNRNTRIDTLPDIYGDDLAAGMLGNAPLRTLLNRTGNSSFRITCRTRKSS